MFLSEHDSSVCPDPKDDLVLFFLSSNYKLITAPAISIGKGCVGVFLHTNHLNFAKLFTSGQI